MNNIDKKFEFAEIISKLSSQEIDAVTIDHSNKYHKKYLDDAMIFINTSICDGDKIIISCHRNKRI